MQLFVFLVFFSEHFCGKIRPIRKSHQVGKKTTNHTEMFFYFFFCRRWREGGNCIFSRHILRKKRQKGIIWSSISPDTLPSNQLSEKKKIVICSFLVGRKNYKSNGNLILFFNWKTVWVGGGSAASPR